jgi:hypothetical protein
MAEHPSPGIKTGAFLIARSKIDEPEVPSGVAIFGSDEDDLSLIYVRVERT